jgi:hypothetical protein
MQQKAGKSLPAFCHLRCANTAAFSFLADLETAGFGGFGF